MTRQAKLTSEQLTEQAKLFRKATSTAVEKVQIMAAIPKTQLAAFSDIVELLANGPLQGVDVYTNKAGVQSGYIVHATGTGKRGLYLSNEAFNNIDEIAKTVSEYKG